ncbi:MAG: tRNA pseudouridine(55) synthase TruB [Alphaproteobacteria bacterium]|nr:tRNA pseudouridine(55) synthase TruB [Alphaproteobacteria bacterium]
MSDALRGWLVIDKPLGLSSAAVVARVRHMTGCGKAGHGGTLDPLATGILPVALGEATKTAGYAVDFQKRYRVDIRWGEERSTDDAEGEVVRRSEGRPAAGAVGAALAGFTGEIDQRPPDYSAIQIGGKRAYRLARAGTPALLSMRKVRVDRIDLIDEREDGVCLEIACGKGFYVRSLARDLARVLGTAGHVAALRRTAVGPFGEKEAISLDSLSQLVHSARLAEALMPLETALDDIPALAVSGLEAARLRCGQRIEVSPDTSEGVVFVRAEGQPVALARIGSGLAVPIRVFNQ